MDKKLIDLFVECWNECETSEKVAVHNAYARENCPDDEVFENDEEFFNLFFEGKPFEAVRSAFFGHYEYSHNYVWFNGYANLDSSDYEEDMPMTDAETMAEWFIEHYDEIDYISSMGEFCDACENGFDEDEEESED